MDKERDHIESKIAASFSSQERKAPAGLWSGISDSLGSTNDEIAIKNSFSNAETRTAPKTGWIQVKRQLIIDEVWNNILAFHERRRRRRIIFWWSGAVGAFVLLIGLSWGFLRHSGDEIEAGIPKVPVSQRNEQSKEESKEKLTSSQKDQKETAASDSEMENQRNETSGGQIALVDGSVGKRSNSGNGQNGAVHGTNGTPSVPENGSTSVSGGLDEHPNLAVNETHQTEQTNPADQTSRVGDYTDLPVASLPIRSVDFVDNSSVPKWEGAMLSDVLPAFKRFEVGVNLFAGNSWLFTNDVKNGFNSNSLIQNKLSKGYSMGVEGIYNFDLRNSIYLTYDVHSTAQQNYSFYESGRLLNKRITLTQQKVLLGYKYNLFHRGNGNFVIRAGGFFTHSIQSETEVDNIGAVDSNFETIDFGMNLGGGMEHTFNRFKVEYGIRSDLGVSNMTANSPNLPKQFDYAHSFLIGGYVSFRYRF